MQKTNIVGLVFIGLFFIRMQPAYSQDSLNFHNTLNEAQATPGIGLGLGHLNTTYGDGEISGIKTNPALLASEGGYQVEANYQWPTQGRELYQVGVVDSKTSKTTTALLYSGHFSKTKNQPSDIPVKHRVHVGFAQKTGKFRLGIGGQYSAGDKLSTRDIKGIRFNTGLVADISEKFKLGASAENLGSKKLAAIAPTTFRTGLSYGFKKSFSLHGSYQRRRLVDGEFVAENKDWIDTIGAGLVVELKSFFIAGSYSRQLQPLWTAESPDKEKNRTSISGSAGFEQKSFRLSYSIRVPELGGKLREQAVQVGYAVKM